MPVIVNGTVVRWDVDRTDPANPFIVFEDCRDVSAYVSDGQENAATAVLAQYITVVHGAALSYAKLVKDAKDGLIEVFGIRSLRVETPEVPPP